MDTSLLIYVLINEKSTGKASIMISLKIMALLAIGGASTHCIAQAIKSDTPSS